jgi:hypothetical protein
MKGRPSRSEQQLRHQARDDVGGAVGGKSHDDPRRLRKISLRRGGPRGGREGGSTRCPTQESPALNVHRSPPIGENDISGTMVRKGCDPVTRSHASTLLWSGAGTVHNRPSGIVMCN